MTGRKTESLVEEFVTLLATHDWYFADSNNSYAWQSGLIQANAIHLVMAELYRREFTEYELKTIYNEYAPEDRFKFQNIHRQDPGSDG